eukprot:GAHX01002132.1.p1 GENE.GAHX01002132.1~~GAHX01002132.1.p1  ORF type:complete len:346 (+),score=50.76 GAHX01002132.1:120-1157(+)
MINFYNEKSNIVTLLLCFLTVFSIDLHVQQGFTSVKTSTSQLENDTVGCKTMFYIHSTLRGYSSDRNFMQFYVSKATLYYSLHRKQFLTLSKIELQLCKVKVSNFKSNLLTKHNVRSFLSRVWSYSECDNYQFDESVLKIHIQSQFDRFQFPSFKEPLSLSFITTNANSHDSNTLSSTHSVNIGFIAYHISNFKTSLTPKEKLLRKKLESLKQTQQTNFQELVQLPPEKESERLLSLNQKFIGEKSDLNDKDRKEILKENISERILEVYLDNELINLNRMFKKESKIKVRYGNINENRNNEDKDVDYRKSNKIISVLIIFGFVLGGLWAVLLIMRLYYKNKEILN